MGIDDGVREVVEDVGTVPCKEGKKSQAGGESLVGSPPWSMEGQRSKPILVNQTCCCSRLLMPPQSLGRLKDLREVVVDLRAGVVDLITQGHAVEPA